MGKFKFEKREDIREIKQASEDTTEIGEEMMEKAEEVDDILKGIHLEDEEDMGAIQEAKEGYKGSYENAHNEQVVEKGDELGKEGEKTGSEINGEIENVRSGEKSMEQAGGISEIGSDAADRAGAALEKSGEEYEEMTGEIDEIDEETKKAIERQKEDLDEWF